MSTDPTVTPQATEPVPATAASTLTVPVHADGSIGTLPEPLQKLLDAQIRQAIARTKAKTPDPVAAEQVATMTQELEAFRLQEAEREKDYAKALALRDERYAKDLEAKQAELDRRTERLTRAVLGDIKAEALRLGARDESLDELVELLGRRVRLDEALEPVALAPDGTPLVGGIAALVAAYLDAKPHHRRAAGGQSMGTTGGVMKQTGGVTQVNTVADIQARIRRQGRATGQDIRDLREAQAAS